MKSFASNENEIWKQLDKKRQDLVDCDGEHLSTLMNILKEFQKLTTVHENPAVRTPINQEESYSFINRDNIVSSFIKLKTTSGLHHETGIAVVKRKANKLLQLLRPNFARRS